MFGVRGEPVMKLLAPLMIVVVLVLPSKRRVEPTPVCVPGWPLGTVVTSVLAPRIRRPF